jgi:hypothetical protein
MEEERSEEVQRWMAKRLAALVMSLFKCEPTVTDGGATAGS